MLATEAETKQPERLRGVLSVTVLQATGLPKADLIGQNDNYCVITLEGSKGPHKVPIDEKKKDSGPQSETCQRTQDQPGSNPIWNEKFTFPIPASEKGPVSLSVKIWDDDIDDDDLVAAGIFDLAAASLDKDWMEVKWIDLIGSKNQPAGKICVVCHYIPESMVAYFGKKYNAKQAEVKNQITKAVVAKFTESASGQVKGYFGI
ncbi:hypothetical protein PhCBS80983_g00115 [Powellomyces hirtus]|uniref:C2 domain-containing protein n=1 Tax=Powellomyces hirtus TaxID=109895 RepID=A0A507EGS2_9FUNG|nr:C2 domain-containing protein [Powellomyces hirtus]TPX62972.1 hypothetical protein PhCBS80983_g00115 [Powellomyces hirtus]